MIVDQGQVAVKTFHQHITDDSILHAFSEPCRVAKCNPHIFCPLDWFGNIISDLHSGCNQRIHLSDNRISTVIMSESPCLFFGGGEEIRTLAPAKPTYRISNPDPSTTWVHLHVLKIGRPIYNLLIHFSGKLLAFC